MDDRPIGEPIAPAKPGDDPGADAAERSPSPVNAPPPLAAKADDLEALRAAVVDAASVGNGLWLSYLAVLAYLTIAIGSVTHKDLFLQSPVKLPFLSVDLPLTSFFWLGPLLFLIMHAYVLLHFVMLADKISAFDRALVAQIGDEEVRTKLRRQLPSNIFVQFLAGPTDLRDGLLGWLLWLIANVTLVIGPVLLLLFFELQFLPYHDAGITWLQRVVVFADLLLLWKFWPAVALNVDVSDAQEDRRRSAVALNVDVSDAREDGRRRALAWRRFFGLWRRLLDRLRRTWRRACGDAPEPRAVLTRAIMLVLLVGSVPLLLLLATFPGEWLEKLLPPDRIPGRAWLVHGYPDRTTRRPDSLFSDRLVLPQFNVLDYTKLDPAKLNDQVYMDALPETASLRGRNLNGAILDFAVLRKADFNGASLQGASLYAASLQGARLEDASLQGATLFRASLQGAALFGASLQGAMMGLASLQGATLDGASLQGATLDHASLQGATLTGARLQGATLNGASLHGATLDGAWLQGATLDHASLQGATLDGAWLQGATLDEAIVWRAVGSGATTSNSYIKNVETSNIAECRNPAKTNCRPWTHKDFVDLRARLEEQVLQDPQNPFRDKMLKRIDELLDPNKTYEDEAAIRQQWENWREQSASVEEAEVERAKQLRTAGCEADSPDVITGLIKRMGDHSSPLFAMDSLNRAILAKSFLAEECGGAHGLSPDQIMRLKGFAVPPPPPETATQTTPTAK